MHSSGRYVLFADDDQDDIILLEEAFRQKKIGGKLVSVQGGNELLSYLHSMADFQWPQVILLDLNMPGKNGREVLTEIKQHRFLKEIPVVIYSTNDNPREIQECYQLGANSYVVKPMAFEKLLSTVEIIHAYWCKTATVFF